MTRSQKLNHALQSAGLAPLFQARQLLEQISVIVRNHDQFRRLISSVEPKQRNACYEALRTRLAFKPKTLDEYMAETKAIASQMESHVSSPLEIAAQEAIKAGKAKGTLTLVCYKCTKSGDFHAETRIEAIKTARRKGWVCDQVNGKWKEICPDCPAVRLQ